jgi:hypothetical protein
MAVLWRVERDLQLWSPSGKRRGCWKGEAEKGGQGRGSKRRGCWKGEAEKGGQGRGSVGWAACWRSLSAPHSPHRTLARRWTSKVPPTPKREGPIKVTVPWYLTAEGLYSEGKGAWEKALETDRFYIGPAAKWVDVKVGQIIESKKVGDSDRSTLDKLIEGRLRDFDEGVVSIAPKVWEKVPLKDKLNLDVPLNLTKEKRDLFGAKEPEETGGEGGFVEGEGERKTPRRSVSRRLFGGAARGGGWAERD